MGMVEDKWLGFGPIFSNHFLLAIIKPGSKRGPRRLLILDEGVERLSYPLNDMNLSHHYC